MLSWLKVLQILKTFQKTGSIKGSAHTPQQAVGYVQKTKRTARRTAK